MKFERTGIFASLISREAILFLVALVVFTLSFQFNFWDAASDEFFHGHQRDSEALVIGRIMETNKNGYLSQGGFMGLYADTNRVDYQYDTYKKGGTPESSFSRYTSSAGLQGFLYAFTNSVMSFIGVESGSNKLFLNKLVTSLLLAAVLSLFVVFAFRSLGWGAAIASVIFLASSQWLVVFSNNLYWMFFLILLPFVITATFLSRASGSGQALSMKLLCGSVFLAIFIKSLAGYEYMSTIFIAMVIPFVFYAIKDGWSLYSFIRKVFWVSVAAVAGFFAALIIHVIQLSYLLGGISKGLAAVWYTVVKRTHGNPDAVHEIYRRSLESSIPEVLLKYWKGRAFNLDSLLGAFGSVTFGELILFTLVISLVGFFITALKFKQYKKLNLAILASVWISILAPLSWHVLAKAHSYIHTSMNHVLWYVPFLLLAFAYMGFVAGLVFKAFLQLKRTQKIRTLVLLVLFVFIVGTIVLVNGYRTKQALLSASTKLQAVNGDAIAIHYANNDLLYFSRQCGENLDARFFLHLVPADVQRLPEHRQQHGFANLDFNWLDKQRAERTWLLSKDFCMAAIALPTYPLAVIRTGQFNQQGQLWQGRIDLVGKRFATTFQPFDLTDRNWVQGISKSHAGFFIENNFENRQSLKVGDVLLFAHSGERVIESLTYSDRYINVFVSGGLLVPEQDGYPNNVQLKPEDSQTGRNHE